MSTKIEQPSPPAQPSTADAVNAWVESLPQVYQTQLEYAPKEAQQQVELAQQYAQPLGQAYLAAQREMYPETTALQEQLAEQASTGMQQGMPDWMREQYRDVFASNVGSNIGSGIGADYISRGLLQQEQNYRDYYRNLALSVAGRQPLSQPSAPSYSNYMGGFTPGQNMNYMANTYGNYSNAYANMYNANAQMAAQNSPANMIGAIGGGLYGVGNALTGLDAIGFMGSSMRFKKNIKEWEKH